MENPTINPASRSQVLTVLHRAFLRVAPGVDLDRLDPEADLVEQTGLQELELDRILAVLEDELGAYLTSSQVETLSTLDRVVDVLSAQVEEEV